ncbi:MAG: DUF4097 family beta strand repeat-containing protein [Blastocatellia bacterium]
MIRRTVPILLSLAAISVSLLMAPQANVTAQEGAVAQETRKSEQSDPEVVRGDFGVVSVKFERGVKISVGNRTTGPIVVVGWDRDFIEASAVSDRGAEAVRVWTSSDPSDARILLKADYADVPIPLTSPVQQPSTSQWPDLPSIFYSRPREISLEMKVPRYAEIEMITVNRSEVIVSGVETAITVSGARSAIKLSRVGAVEVRTSSGDVEIEDANGLVDVITTSGAIVVKNARSDVRALSLNGRIEIRCARGRVDVSNTDGPITLSGVIGDASATATNSDVRFSGPIRAEGRYYLKSMSGAVEMETPANSPGFTASLSSYRGGIETDFSLKSNKANTSNSPVNRRLIGRHGNGQAQITLDSFDGKVRLSKMAADALKDCR